MSRRVVRLPYAEYARMYEATVVPRIDLWVTNPAGKVVLVDRKEDPHAGWWFPGGRFRPGVAQHVAVLDRLQQDLGLDIDHGRLTEVDGIQHYKWGMPSFGITAQLIGTVWRVELGSIEVAGLRLSNKYRQLTWNDPVALAESQDGTRHSALAKIARSVIGNGQK